MNTAIDPDQRVRNVHSGSSLFANYIWYTERDPGNIKRGSKFLRGGGVRFDQTTVITQSMWTEMPSLSKQCRPRSDTVELSVLSGSIVLVTHQAILTLSPQVATFVVC